MSWREDLRPASFRGVVFHVSATGESLGRRVQVHQYPQRDRPFAEDLGRRAREYKVTAFVLGEDYFSTRDRLIAACEEAGSGTLIHPFYGTLEVVCTECALTQSLTDGGSAGFDLTFIEAGARSFPAETPDGPSRTQSRAAVARASTSASFASVFSTDGLPSFVADAAAELIRAAGIEARNALQGIASAESAAAIAELLEDGTVLPQSATAAGDAVLAVARAMSGATDDPAADTSALLRWGSFGRDLRPAPETTATRRQQARNQTALVTLVRRAAVIEAAGLSAAREFDSYQAAVAARDDLADRLDAEILTAGDAGEDNAFAALSDLRAAMVADLSERSRRLARVRALMLAESRPALVIAYELYEDAARDAEIARRNRLAHEGLVPPGVALEVLTA